MVMTRLFITSVNLGRVRVRVRVMVIVMTKLFMTSVNLGRDGGDMREI